MGVMMTVPTINYIANKANTSNKWVRRLIIGIGLIGIGLLASVSIDAIMWIKSLGVMKGG
jgi:hypothetical protein